MEDNLPSDLLPWFLDSLVAMASPIDGEGVFATASIEEGQVLMRVGGYLAPQAARYTPGVVPSTSIGVAEGIVLCELRSSDKDLSDWINHSCDPNAGFLDAISIVAARDIGAGEEVTIDYAYWEGDETWALKASCACGALDCRRAVTGRDWARPDIAARVGRWAAPFIRRRIYNRREE
jgi:uncharacterized protein